MANFRIRLKEFQEALSTVAAKWFQLGLHLGVSAIALHDVRRVHALSGNQVFLEEMLKVWLKKEPSQCTWSAVVDALRETKEVELSNSVAEKYCGREEEKEAVEDVPSYQTQKEEIQVLLQKGYSCNTRSSSASASGTSGYWSRSKSQQPFKAGLCGLSNLGNTGYMNAALQCLSNTQPLTEYFLGSETGCKPYKKHINKGNRLGMGGAIAEAYGGLLEEIWSGKCGCVAPRNFKAQVSHFAPQFLVHAQHDAQEFLAIIFDALHEGLNLVRIKPHVDRTVKTKGHLDKDIAEESWHKHLLQNQSVIVRVFQGQLKSTAVCPNCYKVSKTFDPFMFLSLPLPINLKKTRKMFVCLVLVRADPAADVYKFKVQVPKKGCVMDIKNELRKLTDISTDRMMLVDVHESRFHRKYTNWHLLSHILEDNIYVYELSDPLEDPDWVHVPVYHREQIIREVHCTQQSCSERCHQLFGLPAVVRVPRQQCTYRTLYDAILQQCCRFIKPWSEVQEKPEENIPDNDTEQEAVETEKQNGAAKNGNETAEQQKDGEVREKEEEPEKQDSVMDQFQLVMVNSNGSQDVQKLKDDSNPLRLSSLTYIACDWRHEMKNKCYDVEAAQEVKEHSSCAEQQAESQKNIELQDCFNLYLAEKTLSEDNVRHCPQCKKSMQASFDLWKLPEILVIHLKRYFFDRYSWDKLDVMVDFPMSGLDLTSYVKNPDDPQPVYDLFAVCNHFGGMSGGKYTAYCKNKETGKWYNFDNSHVSEMTEDHVITTAAYVLFYRRQTEGHPVPHVLHRSLSQSFADELLQGKARYQPEGGSPHVLHLSQSLADAVPQVKAHYQPEVGSPHVLHLSQSLADAVPQVKAHYQPEGGSPHVLHLSQSLADEVPQVKACYQPEGGSPHVLHPSQSFADEVPQVKACYQPEGGSPHVLHLSQSFADEAPQVKARYQPEGGSHGCCQSCTIC